MGYDRSAYQPALTTSRPPLEVWAKPTIRGSKRAPYDSIVAYEVLVIDPSDLDAATGLIHDCPFGWDDEVLGDDSDVVFDREAARLTISYAWRDWEGAERTGGFLRKNLFVPTYRAFLEIDAVTDLDVSDRSGIGGTAFNKITYDDRNAELVIVTNYAVDFRVKVDEVAVRVRVTDERTSDTRAREYLGGLIVSEP